MIHIDRSQASAPRSQDTAESASPFVVIGTAEQIRDVLCGPQQHNEHCKGYRWHLYVADNEKRFANVMAELRQMHAERRARIEAARESLQALEAAE